MIEPEVLQHFSENEDEEFLAELITLYTPVKILGKGAFSQVYSAQDTYGNWVAIKVLDKRVSGKAAKREVEILSQLDHLNVVHFYQTRESNRKFYLITELVEGQTLETFMTQPHTNEQIVTIIRQLLDATQYVHSKDIIHRDIKPENILINPYDLRVKLIDFGLSFISQSFQTTHENCGTFIFMAPEMALKKEYFKSVDVWSIGIIQYMLFSQGVHPIWEPGIDTRQSYLDKLQQGNEWKFPESMPKAAQTFFIKTASPHPESRMSSAQALLHPWITGSGELSQPITMADMVQQFQVMQHMTKLLQLVVFIRYLTDRSQSMSVARRYIEPPTQYYTVKEERKRQSKQNDDDSPYSLFNNDTTSETQYQGNFSQFLKNQPKTLRQHDQKKKTMTYGIKLAIPTQQEESIEMVQPEQRVKMLRSASTVMFRNPNGSSHLIEKVAPAVTKPLGSYSPQIHRKTNSTQLGRRTSLTDQMNNFDFNQFRGFDTISEDSPKPQSKQSYLPPLVPNIKIQSSNSSPINSKNRVQVKAQNSNSQGKLQSQRDVVVQKKSSFSVYKA